MSETIDLNVRRLHSVLAFHASEASHVVFIRKASVHW